MALLLVLALILMSKPVLSQKTNSPAETTFVETEVPDEQFTMFEQVEEMPAVEIPSKDETARKADAYNSRRGSGSLRERLDDSFEAHGLPGMAQPLLSVCNTLAYVHLLYLTSRSRSYILELVQLLAFVCFPTLPLVQLLNNGLKTAASTLRGPLRSPAYIIPCLSGQYVFHADERPSLLSTRQRLVDVPASDLALTRPERNTPAQLAALALTLANLAASAASLALSLDRPVRSDWQFASTAQDQRLAWSALAATLAASLALALHALGARWALRPAFAPDHPISLLWETEVFTEIVSAALLQDVAVAGAGGVSLVGTVSVFMANRLVLVLLFIAFAIFNRQLRFFARGILGARYKRRSAAVKPVAVGFSLATCASILMFQGLTALMERRGEGWRFAGEG